MVGIDAISLCSRVLLCDGLKNSSFRGKISHYELSCTLGLDRIETDAYLKKHGVFEGSLSLNDLEADYRTLQNLNSKAR